jgi:hypothetical protein
MAQAFWSVLGRPGAFWIVLDCSGAPCARTFWEVLEHPGPGASWGGLGPPEPDPPEGSVRGVPRLCRCALGRSGAFWRVLKRPGAFWGVLGRPGASLGGLGPPEPDLPEGSVRGVPRLCRCALGCSGAFWRVLKRPGAFWGALGRPGALWGVPKRPGTVPRRSGIVLRRRSMASWAAAPKTRKACVIFVRFYHYFGFRGAQEDTPGQPQPTAGT